MRVNYTFPTRYRFGWGRRVELDDEVARAGITRALVVTDRGVAAQPWFGELARGEVFAFASSNPTEDDVRAGVAAYAGCDGIVAIGGGAPMDVAKIVGLAVTHEGALADFAVGGARVKSIGKLPPIVCVPTTSGTGSELSTGAVIVDPAAKVKRTFLHPALMPRAVVADPELTVGLPPAITAATGMDALTHAIEALCVPSYQPMCDALAAEAIRLIDAHLVTATREPANVEARSQMMMASSLAAMAFHKGLGLCHAMAHPLGAVTGVHHGLANAVLLPHVLALNEVRGMPDVAAIVRACGLPATLPKGPDVDALTRLALAETFYLATNPRAVTADEIAAIYARVLSA